jgi:hypothetical protein
MAKKGSVCRVTGEWAKHLRKPGKRIANKVERHSAKVLSCKGCTMNDECPRFDFCPFLISVPIWNIRP